MACETPRGIKKKKKKKTQGGETGGNPEEGTNRLPKGLDVMGFLNRNRSSRRQLHGCASSSASEIWPLETLLDELGWDGLVRAMAPLQAQVKERSLWAAHLDAALGGQGFGQVKLGLMHEILGTSPIAPLSCLETPPRTPAIRKYWPSPVRKEQKERYLHPLLAGDLKSAFSMTEPDTAGSDPTLLKTAAVRDGDDWVINGHKWFPPNGSIAHFLIVMAVTDPTRGRISARRCSSSIPTRRASLDRARRRDDGASVGQLRPVRQQCGDRLRQRPGARGMRCSGCRAPAFSSPSSGCIRAGSITACAGSGVARRAFDMLCERSLYRFAHGCGASQPPDGAELDRRLRGLSCKPPGS